MKFRHESNFIELDVDQVILNIISKPISDEINEHKLSKLLACMLTKKDVESVLKEFGYVKVE